MEFFLWFWLLDRRFCCDMRPLLKQFAFLWFIPIIIHLIMIFFSLYSVFPLQNLVQTHYTIISVSIIEIISIICLFVMMVNLYSIAKKQPKKEKNIFILFFEKIKTPSKREKDNFVYYEDYWMARKNLLSPNGIMILILSIFHIIWSFYYLVNRNQFTEIYNIKWGEKIPISYCYLNILFCPPVIALLGYAAIVKITFVISAICCTKCVYSISEKCCKKNKGLKRTIDFSDIQTLEPEYV